jgi:hypothetical protein
MVVVWLISVAALQMATQYWHSTDMSEISSRTKKSVTKPLLKGVGGIKLSREAWFSGVVNLSLLLW